MRATSSNRRSTKGHYASLTSGTLNARTAVESAPYVYGAKKSALSAEILAAIEAEDAAAEKRKKNS